MKKFSAKNSTPKSFVCTVAKTSTNTETQLVCVKAATPKKSTKVSAPKKKVATKKSAVAVNSERKLVKAACPAASGIIVGTVSLQNLCFTFDCDVSININSLAIERVRIEPEQTLVQPFETAPLLDPPADVQCPDTETGGDPLVTGIIEREQTVAIDWLVLTNNSTHPTVPAPKESAGPWYFEKEPFSTSNRTVLTVGCREEFDTTNLNFNERFPPIGRNTFSRIDITFDTSILDPLTAQIALDIDFGYSSELNFDFFTIFVDGVGVFQGSGQGQEASDPYSKGHLDILVDVDSVLRVQYLRDPAAYGGVDSAYFVINRAVPVFAIQTPTTLRLTCGETLIKDYSPLVDLDGPDTSLTIDCAIDVSTGCQLCLVADPAIYEQFTVTASYQSVPQIYDHRYDEIFRGDTEFNTIRYNNRRPKRLSTIGGWYNTDDQFARNLLFIEEVSGCSEGGPNLLRVERYSLASSGPYFVNGYFSGNSSFTMTEISRNVYFDESSRFVYIFNSETGELRLDISDPENLPGANNTTITVMLPIRNADERYWQYQMNLTDRDHEFNTPTNFFEFVGQYYKSGFISSQFGIRSIPTWPEINPLQLDHTQVQASYGVGTKAEYDDLFRRLQDIGIKRKYRIQRWVYWPYPATGNGSVAVHPVLTESQKRQLRWIVNQNNYGFLAFVPYVPNEGEHVYPRLCPGETVKLCGTGTRLDGFPLRLAMDGYHTGPKPGPDFVQTYSGIDPRNGQPIPRDLSYDIFKEWSYYTIRLPITITEKNNTIYSRTGGVNRLRGTPTHGVVVNITSIPDLDLGPFQAASALDTFNIVLNPIVGRLVAANPITAATPLINADKVRGNVVLIRRGGVTFAVKLANAIAAGAIAVIIYNNAGTAIQVIDTGGAQISVVTISLPSGQALFNALQSGAQINVNVVVEGDVFKTVLPCGTYYITDIFKQLFDAYVAGESEFYVEIGNFLVSGDPTRPNPYGYNDIFALGGTVQALLFGPNDPAYPSTFFGPLGLDIAYLWGNSPDTPLVGERQSITSNFRDATYAQLLPGQYKTHTPLTKEEAQSLIDSLKCDLTIPVDIENNTCCNDNNPIRFDLTENTNVKRIQSNASKAKKQEQKVSKRCSSGSCPGACPTVSATHGPVTHDMTYEKFVASINELSMQKGTEVHNIIYPWVYKAEQGLYELPINMQELLDKLKTIFIDPKVTYEGPSSDVDGLDPDDTPPIPGIPISATWAPVVYTIPIRATGVGHAGEYSEMYNGGYGRRVLTDQTRGFGRLEWIVARPQEVFFYPEGTVLPIVDGVGIGDISGRKVEIPIVNYLEDPQWLTFGTFETGPLAGAPNYQFAPYRTHTGHDGLEEEPSDVFNPSAVEGDWLIGVLKDEKVRSILGLAETEQPPRYGYITWYISEFSTEGDPSILPWDDPDFPNASTAVLLAAARVLEYFNERNVVHIIVDVRNTVGGNDRFWRSLASLVGDDRYYNDTDVTPVMTLEPNGIQSVRATTNFQVAKEEAGVVEYRFRDTVLEASPSALIEGGLLTVVPEGIWNGETTGQAALGRKSNIIWMSNATSISNPQFQLLMFKGTSLDQSTYNGDLGKSTQFVHYGIYDRPNSTSGSYTSYINWWTRGRTGEEENPVGLMMSIDRFEPSRNGYMEENVDGKGGILKGLDQEFGDLHRPHIKWDMNATVFFQDIGFTVGNPGVIPEVDGEPWARTRYPEVIFAEPLTYRDSALERAVQMANDPNLESHFYQEDGYGYVSQLPS